MAKNRTMAIKHAKARNCAGAESARNALHDGFGLYNSGSVAWNMGYKPYSINSISYKR